jgi:hypothetical protein
MSSTPQNNYIISQLPTAPCGKIGTCDCCAIKHIADSNLHLLNHADKKRVTVRLANELMGVKNELERISVPVTTKHHSISEHEGCAQRCPTVMDNPHAQSNIQTVSIATRRSIGSSMNGASFLNG